MYNNFENVKKCKKCNFNALNTDNYCMKCGNSEFETYAENKIEIINEIRNIEKECPNCKSLVNTTSLKCNKCDYNFLTKKNAVEENDLDIQNQKIDIGLNEKPSDTNRHEVESGNIYNNNLIQKSLIMLAAIVLMVFLGIWYYFESETKNKKAIDKDVVKIEQVLNDSVSNMKTESLIIKSSKSQQVEYNQLSNINNYRISLEKVKDENNNLIIGKINLEVINKSTGEIKQSILIDIEDTASLGDAYSSNQTSQSLITGFNINQSSDGDFGDLVVADFNFDGKEDIAVKIESANSGAFYEFYIFDGHQLVIEEFLTTEIMRFPSKFDSKSKTISSLSRGGLGGYYEKIFKYNSVDKKWLLIEDQYHNYE